MVDGVVYIPEGQLKIEGTVLFMAPEVSAVQCSLWLHSSHQSLECTVGLALASAFCLENVPLQQFPYRRFNPPKIATKHFFALTALMGHGESYTS